MAYRKTYATNNGSYGCDRPAYTTQNSWSSTDNEYGAKYYGRKSKLPLSNKFERKITKSGYGSDYGYSGYSSDARKSDYESKIPKYESRRFNNSQDVKNKVEKNDEKYKYSYDNKSSESVLKSKLSSCGSTRLPAMYYSSSYYRNSRGDNLEKAHVRPTTDRIPLYKRMSVIKDNISDNCSTNRQRSAGYESSDLESSDCNYSLDRDRTLTNVCGNEAVSTDTDCLVSDDKSDSDTLESSEENGLSSTESEESDTTETENESGSTSGSQESEIEQTIINEECKNQVTDGCAAAERLSIDKVGDVNIESSTGGSDDNASDKCNEENISTGSQNDFRIADKSINVEESLKKYKSLSPRPQKSIIFRRQPKSKRDMKIRRTRSQSGLCVEPSSNGISRAGSYGSIYSPRKHDESSSSSSSSDGTSCNRFRNDLKAVKRRSFRRTSKDNTHCHPHYRYSLNESSLSFRCPSADIDGNIELAINELPDNRYVKSKSNSFNCLSEKMDMLPSKETLDVERKRKKTGGVVNFVDDANDDGNEGVSDSYKGKSSWKSIANIYEACCMEDECLETKKSKLHSLSPSPSIARIHQKLLTSASAETIPVTPINSLIKSKSVHKNFCYDQNKLKLNLGSQCQQPVEVKVTPCTPPTTKLLGANIFEPNFDIVSENYSSDESCSELGEIESNDENVPRERSLSPVEVKVTPCTPPTTKSLGANIFEPDFDKVSEDSSSGESCSELREIESNDENVSRKRSLSPDEASKSISSSKTDQTNSNHEEFGEKEDKYLKTSKSLVALNENVGLLFKAFSSAPTTRTNTPLVTSCLDPFKIHGEVLGINKNEEPIREEEATISDIENVSDFSTDSKNSLSEGKCEYEVTVKVTQRTFPYFEDKTVTGETVSQENDQPVENTAMFSLKLDSDVESLEQRPKSAPLYLENQSPDNDCFSTKNDSSLEDFDVNITSEEKDSSEESSEEEFLFIQPKEDLTETVSVKLASATSDNNILDTVQSESMNEPKIDSIYERILEEKLEEQFSGEITESTSENESDEESIEEEDLRSGRKVESNDSDLNISENESCAPSKAKSVQELVKTYEDIPKTIQKVVDDSESSESDSDDEMHNFNVLNFLKRKSEFEVRNNEERISRPVSLNIKVEKSPSIKKVAEIFDKHSNQAIINKTCQSDTNTRANIENSPVAIDKPIDNGPKPLWNYDSVAKSEKIVKKPRENEMVKKDNFGMSDKDLVLFAKPLWANDVKDQEVVSLKLEDTKDISGDECVEEKPLWGKVKTQTSIAKQPIFNAISKSSNLLKSEIVMDQEKQPLWAKSSSEKPCEEFMEKSLNASSKDQMRHQRTFFEEQEKIKKEPKPLWAKSTSDRSPDDVKDIYTIHHLKPLWKKMPPENRLENKIEVIETPEKIILSKKLQESGSKGAIFSQTAKDPIDNKFDSESLSPEFFCPTGVNAKVIPKKLSPTISKVPIPQKAVKGVVIPKDVDPYGVSKDIRNVTRRRRPITDECKPPEQEKFKEPKIPYIRRRGSGSVNTTDNESNTPNLKGAIRQIPRRRSRPKIAPFSQEDSKSLEEQRPVSKLPSSKNVQERIRSLQKQSSVEKETGLEKVPKPLPVSQPNKVKNKRPINRLISQVEDIDSLLDDDYGAESFEEFEHKYDYGSRDLYRPLKSKKKSVTMSEYSSVKPKVKSLGDHIPYISIYKDIDEIIGPLSPDSIQFENEKNFFMKEVEVEGVKIHEATAHRPIFMSKDGCDVKKGGIVGHKKPLNDCTLQLNKHSFDSSGDYGPYLDLESTIDEQSEEFEIFSGNKKNAIILRTQLTVRVHSIIEKLLNSSGRDLRRALFSLKQIFQDDKDLVHEFVQNDGLACLIKVGSEADQNYQNYILRALGQVMLYVDGMNGVISNIEIIQWLYSLLGSKYRLVVKTTLKLLLVFVEYIESNCLLLINAINVVNNEHHSRPWSLIMNLLNERDATDMELLIFAVTLINKTLNGIPDQDTYYDMVDSLEEQGMEKIIQRYMFKQGTNLDLLQQFQIYEAVLKHEDGDDGGKPLPMNPNVRQIPRSRKSYLDNNDRRKSRRHSVGNVITPQQRRPIQSSMPMTPENKTSLWDTRNSIKKDGTLENFNTKPSQLNGVSDTENGYDNITNGLKFRKEWDIRHKSFIKDQENGNDESCLRNDDSLNFLNRVEDENKKNLLLLKKHEEMLSDNVVNESNNDTNGPVSLSRSDTSKKSWMLSMMYRSKSQEDSLDVEKEKSICGNSNDDLNKVVDKSDSQCEIRSGSVKGLQDRLLNSSKEIPILCKNEDASNELNGIIDRAKEGLARAGSQTEVKVAPFTNGHNIPQPVEKKFENVRQWEQLVQNLKRPLVINDLDFTDLEDTDDVDITSRTSDISNGSSKIPPPPPPPLFIGEPPQAPPPPKMNFRGMRPPIRFPHNGNFTNHSGSQNSEDSNMMNGSNPIKNKKTVKLFWKELNADIAVKNNKNCSNLIWDEIKPVNIDRQKLEHLFENRAKEISVKEMKSDPGKKTVITVLEAKRSNAINIGMTKLPPLRALKTAILKMDASIINQEGIEKILTMLPSEEEKTKIQEAQMLYPDTPLGTAEQFLLTLSSISELKERLKLWSFKLEYEQVEKEIAEPLMDLKQGLDDLKNNKTFRVILATLRSVGSFLNGKEVKGFHLDYLAKVPEVKDTVHKHSLLHHLCHIVMEKFPDSSDLYSELGAITRVSKVDFDDLEINLYKLEDECKASWDYLKTVCKHDNSMSLKVKMTDFLTDVAERIVVILIIHRRVVNRFYKTLAFFGLPAFTIKDTKINGLCKMISEFALEYRTTRERVIQQIEKKKNHKERNKTRGKMITDIGKFKTKEQQDDQDLKQLLGNGLTYESEPEGAKKWGTLPGMRNRHKMNNRDFGSLGRSPVNRDSDVGMTDADDDIFESLVKTATAPPGYRSTPRERKRARQTDRKSLRRTLRNGISEEERQFIAAISSDSGLRN